MILVNQGTVATEPHELLQPALTALAGEDALVVAVTGGRDPGELGQVPANARVERFIPFERLLPYVSVLVTNGGFGAVQLALAAGVPIVAAGQTEDKIEVSARVGWSGVGVNLRTQTPRRDFITAAVRQVLADPSYRGGPRSSRPRSPPPVARTVPPMRWRSSPPLAGDGLTRVHRARESDPPRLRRSIAHATARATVVHRSAGRVWVSLAFCVKVARSHSVGVTVGLRALARHAAVVVAAGCLALGCTPQPGPGPTPSLSPTATPAPTPPETARERQERRASAAAV